MVQISPAMKPVAARWITASEATVIGSEHGRPTPNSRVSGPRSPRRSARDRNLGRTIGAGGGEGPRIGHHRAVADRSTEPTERAEPSPYLRPALLALAIPAVLFALDPWRRSTEIPSIAVGTVLVLSGLAMIDRAIRDRLAMIDRAVRDRRSTGPGGELSTGGLYAHSRNPEDLGVLAVLSGLSMASRSPVLGVYLLGTALALHLWIVSRDEPRLAATVPERWSNYREVVPRWLPRPRRPGRVGQIG